MDSTRMLGTGERGQFALMGPSRALTAINCLDADVMKDKKTPTNTGSPDAAPDSSPFSQLLGKFPEGPAVVADKAAPVKSVTSFRVGRTKKGGYPVSLEKRSSGKTVTVIRNVSGDTEALLTLLKKRCAAGGKAFEDWVEVQGDHRDRVETLLRGLGL
jgi:translation initiation factor 1 (eIF-1/SUI1)